MAQVRGYERSHKKIARPPRKHRTLDRFDRPAPRRNDRSRTATRLKYTELLKQTRARQLAKSALLKSPVGEPPESFRGSRPQLGELSGSLQHTSATKLLEFLAESSRNFWFSMANPFCGGLPKGHAGSGVPWNLPGLKLSFPRLRYIQISNYPSTL